MSSSPRRRSPHPGGRGSSARPATSGRARGGGRGPAKGVSKPPLTARQRTRAALNPPSRERRDRRWSPSSISPRRAGALGLIVFVLLVMLVPTGKSWYDQRERLHTLRTQVATQEQAVADLQRERELWATDEYVEAQARQRLKFVMVGEKSYTVLDGTDAPEVDRETGAVRGEPSDPWYDQLGASIHAADSASDAPAPGSAGSDPATSDPVRPAVD